MAKTALEHARKAVMKQIELEMGRDLNAERNTERIIDIDILAFENYNISKWGIEYNQLDKYSDQACKILSIKNWENSIFMNVLIKL